MITTEELASIRAAAIGDMLGDSKALDKLGPAATVFRLCRELELARKHAVTVARSYSHDRRTDVATVPTVSSKSTC